MKKSVLFNMGETMSRVAVLEGQDLAELFIDKNEQQNAVGNVYKGIIEEVIPGLQAVFVNIGTGKNAFLHFNDVNLEPFLAEALKERQGARRRGRTRVREGSAPDQGYYIRVEDCLKRGKEIMVQMTKEPIGTKGARVSSNLALPGKYMVLLPGTENKGGVSKKIEDQDERKRLKTILDNIDVPQCSFIIRTAGIGKTVKELYGDVDGLLDLWEDLQEKLRKTKGAGLLHAEADLIERFVRDSLSTDVEKILIDSRDHADKLMDALESMAPELLDSVSLWDKPQSLFDRYNIEQSLHQALDRKVPLKSGGYLIIDELEALSAIDVNSGRFLGDKNQEEMILKLNLEAATEIARQLRLRDIGGLIVIDFIDMATKGNQRKVLDRLRDELYKDRTKVALGQFSEFGCLEMTRKRVRNSLRRTLTKECPYCNANGRILIAPLMWGRIEQVLVPLLTKGRGSKFEIVMHPGLHDYVVEELSNSISALEKRCGVRIEVRAQKTYHLETYSVSRDGKVVAEHGLDKVESFHEVEYIPPSDAVRQGGQALAEKPDTGENRVVSSDSAAPRETDPAEWDPEFRQPAGEAGPGGGRFGDRGRGGRDRSGRGRDRGPRGGRDFRGPREDRPAAPSNGGSREGGRFEDRGSRGPRQEEAPRYERSSSPAPRAASATPARQEDDSDSDAEVTRRPPRKPDARERILQRQRERGGANEGSSPDQYASAPQPRQDEGEDSAPPMQAPRFEARNDRGPREDRGGRRDDRGGRGGRDRDRGGRGGRGGPGGGRDRGPRASAPSAPVVPAEPVKPAGIYGGDAGLQSTFARRSRRLPAGKVGATPTTEGGEKGAERSLLTQAFMKARQGGEAPTKPMTRSIAKPADVRGESVAEEPAKPARKTSPARATKASKAVAEKDAEEPKKLARPKKAEPVVEAPAKKKVAAKAKAEPAKETKAPAKKKTTKKS